MNPLFTIIVPTYNVAEYLEATLKSITSQSCQDFELLMIDNGATDGSDKIAKAWAAAHENARYIRTERVGVSGSRNHALEEAQGDWIVFVDGDDMLPPDTFLAYKNKIAEDGDKADIYIGQMEEFHLLGSGVYRSTERLSKKESIDMLDADLLWTFMISGKCYRRSFLADNKISFPALRFSEDGVFFMEAVYKGARLKGIPVKTYYYRKRSPLSNLSVTQQKDEELWKDFITAHITILKEFESMALRHNLIEGVESYREQIYDKIIRSTIKNFYRGMWQLTDHAFKQVCETIVYYMSHVSEDTRLAIIEDNKDLYFMPELGSREDYIKEPHFYITIDNNMKEEAVRRTLITLYSQATPAFIVKLPERLKSLGLSYKNIIYVEKTEKPASGFAVDFDKNEEAMERMIAKEYALDLYVDKATCFTTQVLINVYADALKCQANWVYAPRLSYKKEGVREDGFMSFMSKAIKRVKIIVKKYTHKGCLEFRNHKEDYPEKHPLIMARDAVFGIKR